jgi:hypothetical protein
MPTADAPRADDSSSEVSDGGARGPGGSQAADEPGMPDQVQQGTPVALPAGSREYNGIVNLVDPEAADELEAYLTDTSLQFPTKRHGLAKTVNRFLANYLENYDFLYFFTDHAIPTSGVAGKYEAVTRAAQPGTGNDIYLAASEYQTTGRTRAVIGVQYRSGIFPPLGHETAHHWAANLDPSMGFGSGLEGSFGPHWGFAGVNGQLGGFNAASLRCATPEQAMPPNCDALPSGRTRYVVDAFGPNDNSNLDLYGDLELYLMGLASKSEVPATFPVLDQARLVGDSFDPTTRRVQVEANGIRQVTLTDIIARHGEVPLLDVSSRTYKAAFVVISKEPAPDALLDEISRWAAIFGGRETVPGLPSFSSLTGGRARMETALGSRRGSGNPLPPARAPYTCDALAQDCPSGLACYLDAPSYCVRTGAARESEPCDAQWACAPGLDCVAGKAAPDEYVCKPYCDPGDDSADQACAKLCPTSTFVLQDRSGAAVGAICLPM